MVWVLCGVVIVIIGLAVAAASGRFGEVPAVVDDRPVPDLPVGELSGEDLRSVRFDVVARGYSMTQVDELIDRLSTQIEVSSGQSATGDGGSGAPTPARGTE